MEKVDLRETSRSPYCSITLNTLKVDMRDLRSPSLSINVLKKGWFALENVALTVYWRKVDLRWKT